MLIREVGVFVIVVIPLFYVWLYLERIFIRDYTLAANGRIFNLDHRNKILEELLRAISMVKLNCWEDSGRKFIHNIRTRERVFLKRMFFI